MAKLGEISHYYNNLWNLIFLSWVGGIQDPKFLRLIVVENFEFGEK